MYAGLGVLLAGLCASVAVYHSATPGGYPRALPLALTAVGCGAGLFAPAFFTLALTPLRPRETGSAAGLLNAVPTTRSPDSARSRRYRRATVCAETPSTEAIRLNATNDTMLPDGARRDALAHQALDLTLLHLFPMPNLDDMEANSARSPTCWDSCRTATGCTTTATRAPAPGPPTRRGRHPARHPLHRGARQGCLPRDARRRQSGRGTRRTAQAARRVTGVPARSGPREGEGGCASRLPERSARPGYWAALGTPAAVTV